MPDVFPARDIVTRRIVEQSHASELTSPHQHDTPQWLHEVRAYWASLAGQAIAREPRANARSALR